MELGGPFLSPEEVQEVLRHSTATNKGGFILNGQATWSLVPGGLVVTSVPSGQCIGFFKTGQLSVTHVCELEREKQDPLLVLGCRKSKNNSVVAVFSPWSSKLLRAIKLPHDITSMCLLSDRGLDAPSLFTHTVLSEFMGVVAVGCAGGRVVLLDLALGKEDSPVRLSSPRSVEVASVHSESISTHMLQVDEEKSNFAVSISDRFVRRGKFNYVNTEEKALASFHEGSVCVSAVYYAPLMCSLFIGYNFGGFHMFSLSQLKLQYTAPLPSLPVPVTHFTFLEPENDPRPYVFIMVARGPTTALQCDDHPLTVTLYHFAFKHRVRGVHPQSTYQVFEGCSPRLEHMLSSTPVGGHDPASGNFLLGCFTAELPKNAADIEESITDVAPTDRVDHTLAVFVWRLVTHHATQQYGQSEQTEETFMAVFDINRWYYSQMPAIVRWKQVAGFLSCPFMALFSLSDSSKPISPVLDVNVRNLSRFTMAPPVPESHFQPSSLSFDADVLCPSLIIQCKFVGLQRKALKEMTRFHASIVVEPQRLYSLSSSWVAHQ